MQIFKVGKYILVLMTLVCSMVFSINVLADDAIVDLHHDDEPDAGKHAVDLHDIADQAITDDRNFYAPIVPSDISDADKSEIDTLKSSLTNIVLDGTSTLQASLGVVLPSPSSSPAISGGTAAADDGGEDIYADMFA